MLGQSILCTSISLVSSVTDCEFVHRSSFLNSRPSHLQPGNTSVPLPRFVSESEIDKVAFGCACRLGAVVARLQREVSILDRYGSSQRIDSCDSIETDLSTMKEGLKGYYELETPRTAGLGEFLHTFQRIEN